MNRSFIRKSCYFPDDVIDEIHHEAERLDRSLSWLVCMAWHIAKSRIHSLHGQEEAQVGDADQGGEGPGAAPLLAAADDA